MLFNLIRPGLDAIRKPQDSSVRLARQGRNGSGSGAQFGLQGAYLFNEHGGTTARNSAGVSYNDGTLNNGAAFGIGGGADGSKIFNRPNTFVQLIRTSSQNITLPFSYNPSLTNRYTWAMWIYSSVASSTSDTRQALVNGNTSESFGFSWNHISSTFQQAAYQRASDGTTYYAAKCTTSLLANTWYFLAATWNGSALNMYVNGILETVTAGVSSIYASASGPVAFGGNGNYFDGAIGSFWFWDWSLDVNEIKTLYVRPYRYLQLSQPSWLQGGFDGAATLASDEEGLTYSRRLIW